MDSAGNGRTLALLLAIAGSLVTVLLGGSPAAAAAAAVDTVRSGSTPLNIRAAATSASKKLGAVKNGGKVNAVCVVVGQRVRGTVRTTTYWDRLSTGGYVSDAYVVHPPKKVIPLCPVSGASKPGSVPLPAPKAGISSSAAAFFASIGEPARQGYREHRVPASVTMAQAILESGWGKSTLTANDKNYFGIKCFGSPGPIAAGCHTYNTTECNKVTGVCYPTSAVFRVYRSATDSFRDHAVFLANSNRYKPAFAFTKAPKQFAAAIHKAGYATDPKYTEKLVNLMNAYDLYRYDL